MLVTLLGLLGVLVVLFLGAALATRDTGLLRDAPPDRAPAVSRVTGSDDLEDVRFSLALRGYRMAEVDAVLDSCGVTLTAAHEELAAVRQQLQATREQLFVARASLPVAEPVDEEWQEPRGPGTIEP